MRCTLLEQGTDVEEGERRFLTGDNHKPAVTSDVDALGAALLAFVRPRVNTLSSTTCTDWAGERFPDQSPSGDLKEEHVDVGGPSIGHQQSPVVFEKRSPCG